MTVPSSTTTRQRLTCIGAVNYDLAATFKFFDDTDLKVYRVDALGNESLLDLVTDYSVSGGSGASGTVTTVNIFSDGEILVLLDLDVTQGYDMIQGDGFLPDEMEKQLDRQAMVGRQHLSNFDRCLKQAETIDTPIEDMPAPQENFALVWNAANGLKNFAVSIPDVQAGADAAAASAAASQVSRLAAETARGLAETAQAGAETYQGLAETARTGAVTAQGLAEDARDAAIAGQANGYIGFATVAAMTLLFDEGAVAWVTNDPTPSNNGTWRKSGSSGAGSWVQASYDRVALVENRVTVNELDTADLQSDSAISLSDVATLQHLTDPGYLLSADIDGFSANFTLPKNAAEAIKLNGKLTTYPTGDMFQNNVYGPQYVIDRAGNEVILPHNLVLNSEAFANQSVNTTIGMTYTVSVKGSGYIRMTHLGVEYPGYATEGNPVTFIAVYGSVYLNNVGTVDRVQLNYGPTALDYVKTAELRRAELPYSKNPTTGEMMLLVERLRYNELLNSLTPATQAVSLVAGTYTLWMTGAGSCALSGGPTGAATEGAPVTFTLGVTTSVTFTVTGSVTHFQCEKGEQPTSRIDTLTARASRSFPQLTLDLSLIPAIGTDWYLYVDAYVTDVGAIGEVDLIHVGNGTGTTNYLRSYFTATQIITKYYVGGVAQYSSVSRVPIPSADGRLQFASKINGTAFVHSYQGNPASNGSAELGSVFTPTRIDLANWNNTATAAPIYIRRISLMPATEIPVSEVAAKDSIQDQDQQVYDVFVLAGQSNVYTGAPIDPLIDISGGRVFQFEQTGVVSAADEPLDHLVPLPNNIGWGLAFARDYYVPNQPAPRHNVMLLPCGVGNTGFSSNEWNPNDRLFNLTSSAIGTFMKKYPNARLRGILWMQGERDGGAGWTQVQYETALDAMIAAFRAQFGADLPVIVGGLRPAYLATQPTWQPVQDGIAATPARVPFTGYADPNLPSVIGGTDRPSDVHYSPAEHRAFAERFWTAWESL